jgi:homocysteine S-methyltransferase
VASFRHALKAGNILILDGPMGTELIRREVPIPAPLWSAAALRTHPGVVLEIHHDYLRAGADILTTNSFRTARRPLAKAGLGKDAARLTRKSVQLAQEARDQTGGGRAIWIAGSLAPLEDCYAPAASAFEAFAYAEHLEHASHLADAGVDLILIETMNAVSEAMAALRAARDTRLPVGVGLVCHSHGRLLSGEKVQDAARALSTLRPDFVSVNCTPVMGTRVALKAIAEEIDLPLCAYANAGQPMKDPGTWRFDPGMNPESYVRAARTWVKSGARIVGSCCGTGPDYIRALSAEFK